MKVKKIFTGYGFSSNVLKLGEKVETIGVSSIYIYGLGATRGFTHYV